MCKSSPCSESKLVTSLTTWKYYKLYQLARKTCTMYNKLNIRLLILHRTRVSYPTIHSTAKLSHNILQIAVFFIYVHLKTLLAWYWQNWRVHIEHTCGKSGLTATCTNAQRSVFCIGSINWVLSPFHWHMYWWERIATQGPHWESQRIELTIDKMSIH